MDIFRLFRKPQPVEETDGSLEVVAADEDSMQNLVDTLQTVPDLNLPDRAKTEREKFFDLEGDAWSAYTENGIVYLSGADGLVQAQFEPAAGLLLSGALTTASAQAAFHG